MAIKPLKKSTDFYTLFDIEWNHNHSTALLHSLTSEDKSLVTKSKIERLFHAGLLPGVMREICSECENDLEYQQKLADRAIIPRRPDINGLHERDVWE